MSHTIVDEMVAAAWHALPTELCPDPPRPTYSRHKPGAKTVVALEFQAPWGVEYGYATRYELAGDAATAATKARCKRLEHGRLGQGLRMADENTLLWIMPNDARLGRLRWYTSVRKLKRSLSTLHPDRLSAKATSVHILRYKPERRLVARVEAGTSNGTRGRLLVRYTAASGASRLADLTNHLQLAGVSVPRPVATLDADRVSVDQFVEGREVFELLVGPERHHHRLDPRHFAETLALLHSTPAPASAGRRGPKEDLLKALSGLEGLCQWMPGVADIAAHLVEALSAGVPAEIRPATLTHGDMHLKNLLATSEGFTFVDLERCAAGSPETDLGVLLAHRASSGVRPNRSVELGTFCERAVGTYVDLFGVDDRCLRWWTAVGLVDQALLAARHLEARWQQTVAELLTLALDQANEKRAGALW